MSNKKHRAGLWLMLLAVIFTSVAPVAVGAGFRRHANATAIRPHGSTLDGERRMAALHRRFERHQIFSARSD